MMNNTMIGKMTQSNSKVYDLGLKREGCMSTYNAVNASSIFLEAAYQRFHLNSVRIYMFGHFAAKFPRACAAHVTF